MPRLRNAPSLPTWSSRVIDGLEPVEHRAPVALGQSTGDVDVEVARFATDDVLELLGELATGQGTGLLHLLADAVPEAAQRGRHALLELATEGLARDLGRSLDLAGQPLGVGVDVQVDGADVIRHRCHPSGPVRPNQRRPSGWTSLA